MREFVTLLKDQLEDHAGVQLQAEDVILQWMIRWAAMLTSRFLVGVDGKTGYERRRGRSCNIPVVRFGEKVWYRELKDNKAEKGKLETHMAEGVWLGHSRSSNEILIGTPSGVIRAYDVRRMPEDKCWDGEAVLSMKGTPAQPDPAKRGPHIPIRVHVESPKADAAQVEDAKHRRDGEVRQMPITDKILQ